MFAEDKGADLAQPDTASRAPEQAATDLILWELSSLLAV